MIRSLVFTVLVAAAGAAAAHGFQAGTIAIGHPWGRATPPGAPTGGGYLKLDNRGPDDRLISASSPVAERVELHTMKMEGDVMRMRQVDAIDVPTGKTVELKPGGLHLMMVGLKAPLKEGTMVPATLKFEKAGEVHVELKIEPAGGSAPAHDMSKMAH
jgi:copper(I)-binding protein